MLAPCQRYCTVLQGAVFSLLNVVDKTLALSGVPGLKCKALATVLMTGYCKN